MKTLQALGQFLDDAILGIKILALFGMIAAIFLGPIHWIFSKDRTLGEAYLEAFVGSVMAMLFVVGIVFLLFSFVFLLVVAWFVPPYIQAIIYSIFVHGASLTPSLENGWINNTLLSIICVIPIVILIAERVVCEVNGFVDGFKEGRAERQYAIQLKKELVKT